MFARFVDRDMFMRYSGEGIGHKSTCRAIRSASGTDSHLHHKLDECEWFDEEDILVVPGSDGDTQSETSDIAGDDEDPDLEGDSDPDNTFDML